MPKRPNCRDIYSATIQQHVGLFSPLGRLSKPDLPHMPDRHTITSLCPYNIARRAATPTSLWILIPCNCIFLTRPKSCHTEGHLCPTHPRLPLARLTSRTLRWIALLPFRCTFRSPNPSLNSSTPERCPQTLDSKTSYRWPLACTSHAQPRARPCSVSSTAPPDTTPRRRHDRLPEPGSPPHGTHLPHERTWLRPATRYRRRSSATRRTPPRRPRPRR